MGSRTFYQALSVFLGLGLIVLLALPAGPIEQRSRHEERRALVAGRPVRLVSQSARVRVRPSPTDELKAVADLRLESRDDRWLAAAQTRFDLRLEEREGALELSIPKDWAHHEPRPGGFLSLSFDQSYHLELEVEVPKGTTLRIENRYGDVDVDEIEGRLEVELSSGQVVASKVRGGARIEHHYGDLKLVQSEGDVELQGASGKVSVQGLAGALLVEHSYGDVELSEVAGPIQVEMTSGNLEVRRAEGAVTVTSRYGDIEIEGLGGALALTSESGGVRVRGLSPGAQLARHRVTAKYGGIDWTWPAAAPLPALDLRTQYGTLDCQLPGTASEEDGVSTFVAAADSANPQGLLALEATSGDVAVRRE